MTAPSRSTHTPLTVMLFCDTFVRGGTERQLIETARGLKALGHTVHIGCVERSGAFLDDVLALDLPIVEFPFPSLASFAATQQFARLVRLLRGGGFHVVHAFDFYGNLFAVPAARIAHVPAVLASRREVASHRSRVRRWAMGVSAWLANGVVANSRAAADSLPMATRGKVRIIPNSIDVGRFAAGPAASRSSLGLPDGPLIGMVAALRPEKDVPTLLRSVPLIRQLIPDARVVLVGDGSERSALTALAEALEIGQAVTFLGDRQDVSQLLPAFDVVVLSSISESFPNAILEAMACGRPVVATQAGGTPELVLEGVTGFLVNIGDHHALAGRIASVLRDAQLADRLGRSARELVERRFAHGQTVASVDAFYDDLLSGTSAHA